MSILFWIGSLFFSHAILCGIYRRCSILSGLVYSIICQDKSCCLYWIPTFLAILSLITIWCLRYLQVRSHEIKNGTPSMVIPFALLSSLAYILSFAQMGTSWKGYYDDDDDDDYKYYIILVLLLLCHINSIGSASAVLWRKWYKWTS